MESILGPSCIWLSVISCSDWKVWPPLCCLHCLCPFMFSRGHSPTVVLGAHSLSKNEPMKQTFEIKEFIPFSGFKSGTNDIMLIKVGRFASLYPFNILTWGRSVNWPHEGISAAPSHVCGDWNSLWRLTLSHILSWKKKIMNASKVCLYNRSQHYHSPYRRATCQQTQGFTGNAFPQMLFTLATENYNGCLCNRANQVTSGNQK